MIKLANLVQLFLLFSFIKNEPIIIEFNSAFEPINEKEMNKIQSFEVIFKENFEKNYLKIEVTSSDENQAPILCFSNSDESCKDRKQLVKNPNDKNVIMWLKKEEFQKEDNDKLYIIIQCQTEKCNYVIDLIGEDVIKFGPNFVYSYLVGENNKEMKFQVNRIEKEVYMTAALDGSSKGSLNINESITNIYSYKTGKVQTFFIEKEINSVNIEINGVEVGEYITFSVHIGEISEENIGVIEKEILVPNGPEITSYLEKEKINKECYIFDLSDNKYESIDKFYITGRIHNKYGIFSIEDENHSIYYYSEIKDGLLSLAMTNNKKMNYICFEFPSQYISTMNQMAFSFYMTQTSKLDPLYNYYPPQLNGEIYRRIIKKGEIAFFSGIENGNSDIKYDYYLFQRKGVTKMYIAICRTYPDCHYSEDVLDNLYDSRTMNQMEMWSTSYDKSSDIGYGENIIVAHCIDDGNDESDYCEFETSIFSKEQEITLIENEKFSKFVLKEEKGKFIAEIGKERKINSLNIDIMILSGDVSFKLINDLEEISYDKYYLTNKVFFNIILDEKSIEKIILEYKASTNSFFTIQYIINNNLNANIPSGESYLIQIDPNSDIQTKNISLSNRFWKNENLFLANFFELNCKFEVKRNGINEVKFFDGYAQDILLKQSEEYKSDNYNYSIKIKESDKSVYNKKMCMLYVAGYEDEIKTNREIMVGENINQQIIFENNLKKIRFLYPHTDNKKDLVVHFNIIDKAFYKYEIYAKNKKISGATITKTYTTFLRQSTISRHCDKNNVCPIVVQVELDKPINKLLK